MSLLSVVIPTCNSEVLIERCLNSLILQTYQDFEICIIDGASSDGTIAKVNQLRAEFQNIRILSEPDLGIYDAMNKGINFSKGEWIYFLGSDDEIRTNNVFRDIFCNKSNLVNDIIYGNISSQRLGSYYDGEFDIEKLYAKNICHQAIFFKRHVFEKIGLYDLKYKVWSDYDHNVKWFCDKRIRKKFVDNTIANYSDIGYSSLNEDLLFISHKPSIFLKKGFFHLKYKTQINILLLVEERTKHTSFSLFVFIKLVRKIFLLCNYLFLRERQIL